MRQRIAPLAVVQIRKIDSNGGMPYEGLSRAGVGHFNLLVAELLWAAIGMYANCFH
jgi:hypothetical protein